MKVGESWGFLSLPFIYAVSKLSGPDYLKSSSCVRGSNLPITQVNNSLLTDPINTIKCQEHSLLSDVNVKLCYFVVIGYLQKRKYCSGLNLAQFLHWLYREFKRDGRYKMAVNRIRTTRTLQIYQNEFPLGIT